MLRLLLCSISQYRALEQNISSSYLISKKLNTSCETIDSLPHRHTTPPQEPWNHPSLEHHNIETIPGHTATLQNGHESTLPMQPGPIRDISRQTTSPLRLPLHPMPPPKLLRLWHHSRLPLFRAPSLNSRASGKLYEANPDGAPDGVSFL